MLGLGSVVPWLGSTVQVLSVLLIRIFRFSIIFLGFEFATSFCFQLHASRYTTGHNRTSDI